MGRVSAKGAKKGRISHLAFDDIKEERLRISCVRGEWSIDYALECCPDSDNKQVVINAALDDQALDMD